MFSLDRGGVARGPRWCSYARAVVFYLDRSGVHTQGRWYSISTAVVFIHEGNGITNQYVCKVRRAYQFNM